MSAQTTITGTSSSQSPYLIPSVPGCTITSVLTASDVAGGYRMCGLADGTGAYDNGDGTFTFLINHEMGNTSGVNRAHGQKGAFVSKWIINKNTLAVVSGTDLIQNVNLWNGSGYTNYNASNSTTLCAFGRFCSADLPEVSAFYNSTTSLGTQDRIFMNGEESGSEGRAFAHIASGTNAGSTYELPHLGKASWENAVAKPNSGNKTVVCLLDDSSPGQVYFYIGAKTNTGTPVDKAGLTNGKLYGVSVNGMLAESSASVPVAGTTFTLIDLGNVSAISGASLNTLSNNSGVTTFLRPEDGAWNLSSPNDFYFVTTNSFTSPSRLWKLTFTNASNPELGGTITAVLDGTEGPKMMDNMCINSTGQILIQEDPGNQSYLARMWSYDIAKDIVTPIAEHDPARFVSGASSFLTQDEEASGIIDASSILGPNTYLFVDQAHYSIPGEVVEGGQILVLKLNATTLQLQSQTMLVKSLKLYPNPADRTATIKFNLDRTEQVSLKVYDVNGHEVASVYETLEIGDQELTFSTASFASGTYFVKVSAGDVTISNLKLTVTH
ncbi:MAG: T9SS type A sorting domain-containing protein [Sediminibacterium sp.]|nr:T9SS type A sorting domain-containing protein [Sediminibacterium sp.]